jgi:transposase
MDKQVELSRQARQNRYFSEEFKKQKVNELDQNLLTVAQVVNLYQVSRTVVYKWLAKYSAHYQKGSKMVIEMESEATKTQALLARQAELERIVGQKQMEIDFLNRLLLVASEELQVDIKKRFLDPPSSGFKDIGGTILGDSKTF